MSIDFYLNRSINTHQTSKSFLNQLEVSLNISEIHNQSIALEAPHNLITSQKNMRQEIKAKVKEAQKKLIEHNPNHNQNLNQPKRVMVEDPCQRLAKKICQRIKERRNQYQLNENNPEAKDHFILERVLGPKKIYPRNELDLMLRENFKDETKYYSSHNKIYGKNMDTKNRSTQFTMDTPKIVQNQSQVNAQEKNEIQSHSKDSNQINMANIPKQNLKSKERQHSTRYTRISSIDEKIDDLKNHISIKYHNPEEHNQNLQNMENKQYLRGESMLSPSQRLRETSYEVLMKNSKVFTEGQFELKSMREKIKDIKSVTIQKMDNLNMQYPASWRDTFSQMEVQRDKLQLDNFSSVKGNETLLNHYQNRQNFNQSISNQLIKVQQKVQSHHKERNNQSYLSQSSQVKSKDQAFRSMMQFENQDTDNTTRYKNLSMSNQIKNECLGVYQIKSQKVSLSRNDNIKDDHNLENPYTNASQLNATTRILLQSEIGKRTHRRVATAGTQNPHKLQFSSRDQQNKIEQSPINRFMAITENSKRGRISSPNSKQQNREYITRFPYSPYCGGTCKLKCESLLQNKNFYETINDGSKKLLIINQK